MNSIDQNEVGVPTWESEQTFRTLSYFDGMHFASRIKARCLFSVGLMDTICPPSTVFAAYNEIAAGKDIAVHPFTGHEVPTAHVERQLRHLRDFLR